MNPDDQPEKPPKPPRIDVNALWCIYIISVAAACNAELVTYPLDLIKTRLQVQGEKAATTLGQAPKRGMLKTASGIVKEEGIFKLWQGISAIFVRHLIYSGSRIVVYRELKTWISQQFPNQQTFPVWQSAFCGVSAGVFAQFLASPADLVKVQLQMEGKRRLLGLPPRFNGMYDAFHRTWTAGGIKGLWKGCVPNVQRAALVNLGDLSTYDVAKRFIQKKTGLPDQYLLHTSASAVAGFVAAIMSTPADVIKTRVMNQPFDEKGRGMLYSSSTDCLRKTVQDEGFGALYKGFIPTWIRLAPWALTFWLSYEQILILIGGKTF